MQELLMFMYHLTPLFQFWLTAFGAALLIWLDSMGMFDDVGHWIGRTLREVLDAVSED